MEKLDINKLEAKDGVITIVRRKDAGKQRFYNKAVKITGTIASAGNYFEERKSELKKVIKRSHVVYDYRKLSIELIAIENNDINAQIKGTLTLNPDIKMLQINTGQKLASKDLYNLLRMNKFFFAEKAQCQAIVDKLQSSKTAVEKNIEIELNKGGGKERNVYDVAVRGIDPMFFDVKLPIYLGQEDKTFRVEINIDARTGDILFWLESMELEEILREEARRIINGELKRFEGSGLVMIEQ